MTVVSVPEQIYRSVRRHLLPWRHRAEEAAFLYTVPTDDVLEYLEWFPVPASGFASRSPYHLELNEDTHSRGYQACPRPWGIARRNALTSRLGPGQVLP